MTAELDDTAEQKFGPYTVYERLGVGGMATVHRAREGGIEGFERMVALKRLLPHLAEDASFIKAFVREAKLASMLDHTNIVKIYELGRVGTEYFISMEYIEGRDIRRILRHARKFTGPPPFNITVGILLQLCDALDYAHTRTDEDGRPMLLVHRDVSPSNVIVSTTGQIKVIDFGIAKAQTQQHRTQTGRVKGKLAYLAPEAVTGRNELDARSDLFAVGVIAHELLTARPLFASKNEYDTLIKVQRGDVQPPSEHNSSCPPELDAIVLKALARDRDDRYRSAAAMRDDLMRLRQRYTLQTSARDVAMWVDAAFAADTVDPDEPVIELVNRRTPLPRAEDDEAVEIAWGSGEPDRPEPIVLDDVPDVSEKHRAPVLFDDEDDLPTPVPTHGSRSGRQAPTLAEPDEDFDAPLDLAQAPSRASRISESRLSSRQRTSTQGQALLDALDEANLAAETLRGMQAQSPDTQPSMAAAPSRPSNDLTIDDDDDDDDPVAEPPPPDPPRRASSPVITSAPRFEDPATRRIPLARLTPVPARLTPPPAELTPSPDEANPFEEEEPETKQITLRPTPVPARATPRPTPSTLTPQVTEPVVRFKPTTKAPDDSPDALAPTWPTEPVPKTAKIPTTPANEVTVSATAETLPLGAGKAPTTPPVNKSPTTPPANKPPTYPPPTYDVALGLPLNTPVKGTRPGHAPAPAIPMPSERAPSQFGAALIERSQKPKRWGLIVAGVAVAGAIGTVVTLGLTHRSDKAKDITTPTPPTSTLPAPSTAATLKLVTEPADTEISVEGRPAHSGSPWSTELAPGTYQIQITHAGYKSWLTSLELSPNENYTLRVVLEKLPPASAASKAFATLILSSTPSGLEAELDGKLLPMKTPIRMPLSVGPHAIALRKDGAVVWRQELEASAAVDYEFNPSMEPAKQRERNERLPAPRATFTPRPIAPLDAAPPTTPDSGSGSGSGSAAPAITPDTTGSNTPAITPPVTAPDAAPTPPPVITPPLPTPIAPAPTTPAKPPTTTTPAVTTTKPTTPTTPATPTAKTGTPMTVPPNAVTKISGATPQLSANANLPSVAAAKLCISAAGRVTSVELITKLDVRSAADLTSTLKKWTYAPYNNQPVCFAVSLRLK